MIECALISPVAFDTTYEDLKLTIENIWATVLFRGSRKFVDSRGTRYEIAYIIRVFSNAYTRGKC